MVMPLGTTFPGSKKALVKGPAGLQPGIEISEPQFPYQYNRELTRNSGVRERSEFDRALGLYPALPQAV